MPNRRAALMTLTDLVHRYHAWHADGLRQIGLTPVRARAIFALWTEGPQRQHALSTLAGCSPQQMNGVLEALEAQRWIIRKPDPQDGRATSISLTPSGTQLAELIDTLRAEGSQELFGQMSDEQVEEFLQIAAALLEQIGAPELGSNSTQRRSIS